MKRDKPEVGRGQEKNASWELQMDVEPRVNLKLSKV